MRSDRENGGQYLRIIEGKLISRTQTYLLGLNHHRNTIIFKVFGESAHWRLSYIVLTRPEYSANWRRSVRNSRKRRLSRPKSHRIGPNANIQGNSIRSTTTKSQTGVKQQNHLRHYDQSDLVVQLPMVASWKSHRNRPIFQRTSRSGSGHECR